MITPARVDSLRSFSAFQAMPNEVESDLLTGANVLSVPSGRILSSPGEQSPYYPLVMSGRARIYVTDSEGREITLYRLDPGDGCVLAATCSICNLPSPGFAVVEVGGDALLIPATTLRAWVESHTFWRDYVFSLIALQLGHVLAIVNELAFERLDTRIALFLLRNVTNGTDRVRATHQAIAHEIGTRREVASRILKQLERDGLLALERGCVRVRDQSALEKLAGSVFNPFGDIGH